MCVVCKYVCLPVCSPGRVFVCETEGYSKRTGVCEVNRVQLCVFSTVGGSSFSEATLWYVVYDQELYYVQQVSIIFRHAHYFFMHNALRVGGG